MPLVTTTPAPPASADSAPLAPHAVLYPGLADVVAGVGKALSIVGGRSVRTTLTAVTRTSSAAARDRAGIAVAATGGGLVEVSDTILVPLEEALMGLRARPATATSATTSQLRQLRTHVGPALRPVVAALASDPASTFALTTVTGDKAWTQLRADHLDALDIAVTVDGIEGRLRVLLPAVPAERPTANAAAVAAVATVPVTLSAVLPATAVSAARLAALAPGQELVLGSAVDSPWLLYAAGTLLGTGQLGRSHNRVALTITTTRKETDMPLPNTPTAAIPTGAEDETGAEVALGVVADVEIDVTVRAGQVTMPVHELQALREGAVIALDRAPDAPVDVLANGRKVATGQLLQLEDRQMALRILTVGS